MRRTKWIARIAGAAFILTVSSATMTVFAAEAESPVAVESEDYSYLAGRQRSISRNELYAQAAVIGDEDERAAFLIENGIADTEYSAEAAASYSYVGGREKGSKYADSESSEAKSGYSYTTGIQRGASYHQ